MIRPQAGVSIMCEQCDRLKVQIARGRRFLSAGLDAEARARIEQAIKEAEAELVRLEATCTPAS